MYTVQALWTMAREKTDVVVVLLKNDAYAILGLEMARVRENELNARMKSMLDLGDPTLDWVKIATGHGVPATRATTAEEFHRQFEAALGAKGPHLIECQIVTPKEWLAARGLRSPQPLNMTARAGSTGDRQRCPARFPGIQGGEPRNPAIGRSGARARGPAPIRSTQAPTT